ncbi:hypothetical protein COB72_10130 [bacterium]|nr:MAG: hypothetical protein COB72_10130 [bacterium]
MPIQKHPFTQVFTCHACGYDMHDRAGGDRCPECDTPLNTRHDLPGAESRSKRAVVYMIFAMVISPIVPPIAFGFIYPAIATVYWLKPKKTDFRIAYHITKRRKLIEILVYVWFFEFLAMMWLDEIWPPFMEWW